MFEQIVFEKVTQRKGNNTMGQKLSKFQCDHSIVKDSNADLTVGN